MAQTTQMKHAQLQRAAEWYALLQADDATEQDRLHWRLWLDQDEAHRKAWQTIEAVGARFASLRNERTAATAALKAARRLRGSRRQVLGALGILLGTGALTALPWRHASLYDSVVAWRADYHTGIGEIREIDLTDGTRVWLNTASALNVDYRRDLRHLDLVSGEILIDTAKDARPFIVESKHGRMRALGTRFSIRQTDLGAQLAVFEGAVELRTAQNHTQRIIQAGQQVDFTPDRIDDVRKAVSADASWSRGLLVADNMPLETLIKELRRYRRGHLGISPALADLRVIGTYPLQDTDQALTMLAQALPVKIRRTMPWWVTVEPGST